MAYEGLEPFGERANDIRGAMQIVSQTGCDIDAARLYQTEKGAGRLTPDELLERLKHGS